MNTCPCCYIGEVDPCSKSCTCRYPQMSGGCKRCVKYGSYTQRAAAAKAIVEREAERDRLWTENNRLKAAVGLFELEAVKQRMIEPLECEMCDYKFNGGDLVPICNLCWNEMAVERDRYKAALEKIREKHGRVCGEFELCHHTACASSHASWETADEALRGKEKLEGKME